MIIARPIWPGFLSVSLVVVTAVYAFSFLQDHSWGELISHLGMSVAVMVSFYSGWAPAIIVILFICTGMVNLLFLIRSWGGWYFATMSMIVTFPIALSMLGFPGGQNNVWYEQVVVVAITSVTVGINGMAIARQQRRMSRELKQVRHLVDQMQEVYTQFNQIISGVSEIREVLWLVVDLCIPMLGLEDCVIYLYNEDNGELEQAAAYGPKSLSRWEILSPIKIKIGDGIVGRAASLKQEVRIDDLSKEENYILDGQRRLSELAVPILFEGKVYGVIDSEHSEKHYFTDEHIVLFRFIASLCSAKIGEHHLINSKLEQANTQRELDQFTELESMRNTFLNNLSHDLRTPLSLVKGPLQEISKLENSTINKLASIALKNANRLNDMVSGLLEMHKLERGGLQVMNSPTDLSVKFTEWHALFLHEAESREIKYELCIGEWPPFNCDAMKIGQILQNLLSNAFKFTPDGGEILLKANLDGDELILEVHDSGPGIPKESESRIFERFFKVDSNSHIQGTGLGLAIVKEISELLGGNASIIKSQLGGAAFCIRLPIKIEPDYSGFERRIQSSASKEHLVILVEDHPEMRGFVSGLLEKKYEVLAASDAETGWKLILHHIPDLVITDLMLPGMSGEMLCKRIKGHVATDHLPVIALSAKQSVKTRIDLYGHGADNYLTKPFDSEELLGMAASLIQQRQKLRLRFINGGAGGPKTGNGMRRIDEIIHRELGNPDFGPRDLEKEFGMNRNQLQKKIKSLTSYTPVEYIRAVRLEVARSLIKDGHCNISEAAYRTGFNQVSYFSKMYKRQFGLSPSSELKEV
jgi:CheY-like chemotaxis protein/nitrogen-specific signal transduction histidine kinase